jgi:hypothetical protein
MFKVWVLELYCCSIGVINFKVQTPEFARCNNIVWPLSNGELIMLWVQSTIDHGIMDLDVANYKLELGSWDLKGGHIRT